MTFELTGKRVWVAGHRGMVGSAVMRRLEGEGVAAVLTATSSELDLRRQADVEAFANEHKPDVLILAAAKVGGIHANRSAQAEFLYDNLMIAANAIDAAHKAGAQKTVVLGSSCIYPRDAEQPMTEKALLTGPLEATNEGYAIAKIAALELAKMYRRQYDADMISLMPTNLYGPGDNFDLEKSHVMPALIRKIHDAKLAGTSEVEIWGTGAPRREFLHVDDLADATVFLTKEYSGEEHLNIGVGQDISIKELAELIADIIGWSGDFAFNTEMPDGTPRKLLDVTSLAAVGWKAQIELREGIAATYQWFLDNVEHARGVES